MNEQEQINCEIRLTKLGAIVPLVRKGGRNHD